MLEIREACVDYPGHRAFEHFNLQLHQGEMVSIVGTSGCGKTSLLYAIAGLLSLSGGTASVTGGTENCKIMFQQDRLLPWKSAIDNILLGLSDEKRSDARQLLEQFGLAAVEHRYPDQLSGGMRQRVALARALIHNPRLLLLDEPLAALDEQYREKLQDDIKTYVKSRGITLLLVTHSVQEAVFMSERVVIMTPHGISYELSNPYSNETNLRELDEFFTMQRVLRKELGSSQ